MSRTLAAVSSVLVLVTSTPSQTPEAATASIEQALEEVKKIGEPPFDPARKEEPGYREAYQAAQHELYRKKAAVLLAACRQFPDDNRVPDLMNRRWVLLGWNQKPLAVADEVLADVESVLSGSWQPPVKRHGMYWLGHFRAHRARSDAQRMRAAIEPFLATYPDDERGADLLSLVADEESASNQIRVDAYRLLAKQYAQSYAGRYATGKVRQFEGIGRPFELSFRDAISDREVSIAGLRGKVVVIDFWSTTCGPCLAEMPQMRQVYAAFRDRGVEFIGVSLDVPADQGGLEALRKVVREREIPWPQYFQGNGFDSEFSKSWGVGGIPAVFVVDQQGRLHSTSARGKLDQILVGLLSK